MLDTGVGDIPYLYIFHDPDDKMTAVPYIGVNFVSSAGGSPLRVCGLGAEQTGCGDVTTRHLGSIFRTFLLFKYN